MVLPTSRQQLGNFGAVFQAYVIAGPSPLVSNRSRKWPSLQGYPLCRVFEMVPKIDAIQVPTHISPVNSLVVEAVKRKNAPLSLSPPPPTSRSCMNMNTHPFLHRVHERNITHSPPPPPTAHRPLIQMPTGNVNPTNTNTNQTYVANLFCHEPCQRKYDLKLWKEPKKSGCHDEFRDRTRLRTAVRKVTDRAIFPRKS